MNAPSGNREVVRLRRINKKMGDISGAVDGARTRDLRRDRPAL